MKYKTYKYGNYTCKTYYNKVGNGYECGFIFNGKTVFVGNFIYQPEATRWFGIMNREISKFAKKYTTGYKYPTSFMSEFVRNYLYRYYYAYLDKLFARYNRSYQKAYAKNTKYYHKNKKSNYTGFKVPYLKVVA